MASINGVEVKNLKTRIGHEGPASSGTIYIDGKRMGAWEQDSWGGCDWFESRELRAAVAERAALYKEGCDSSDDFYDVKDDPDVLMGEVLRLKDMEGVYKKCAKDGYPVLVTVVSAHVTDSIGLKMVEHIESVTVQNWIRKMIARQAEYDYGCKSKVVHYESLKDFSVVVDKAHPVR